MKSILHGSFTEKEKEKIERNSNAFDFNFEPVRIEKDGKQFYVYCTKHQETYIQLCENIDYLNGWLYGAVQCNCKMVHPIKYNESKLL